MKNRISLVLIKLDFQKKKKDYLDHAVRSIDRNRIMIDIKKRKQTKLEKVYACIKK